MNIIPKRNIIDKNKIPSFLSEFLEVTAKTLDKLDLFEGDGWLSSIPFGKLLGHVAKRIIEKNNVQEALSHAVRFSLSITFHQALTFFKINPQVSEDDYQFFLKEIKDKHETIKSKSFDISNFSETLIFTSSLKPFIKLLEKSNCPESLIIQIIGYLKDYSRITFIKLLEENQTVYGKLNSYLDTQSHKETTRQYKKEVYNLYLKNLFNKVTLNDDAGMTLNSIYVNPEFSVFEKCFEDIPTYNKINNSPFASAIDLKYYGDVHYFINTIIQGRRTSMKGLNCYSPQLILIYGYPGQGKTSFCKKLLNDIFTRYPVNKDIFFIQLKNINEPSLLINNLNIALINYVEEYYDIPQDKLNMKNAIFILDGLDELYIRFDKKNFKVEDVIWSLIRKTNQNEKIQFIVTSRYGYLDLIKLPLKEILVLQLNEFRRYEQLEWLNKYRIYHPETSLTDEFLDKIHQSNHYISELISQPLLLNLIARSDLEKIKDGSNKAQVYETLFNQITNPKHKKYQIAQLKGLNSEDLRKYIQDIAFQIFITNNNFLRKKQIEELEETQKFKKILEKRGVQYQSIIKTLNIAFYMKDVKHSQQPYNIDDDYGLEFLHRSLQEYYPSPQSMDSKLR